MTQRFNGNDSESKDRFANAVFISGDILAVGAPLHDGAAEDAGAVYIFERPNDTWKQTAKLTASDPEDKDRFGRDVAIDKDVVIDGSPLDDDASSKSGSAYISVRNADGSWTEQAKLKSSDLAKGDQLGNTVDITRLSISAYAIVGAHFDDDAGDKSGSAYIFMRDQAGAWAEQKKLTASDAEKRDQFGIDVAIDVNRAIVGANQTEQTGKWEDTGSAYSFLRIGTDWVEQSRVDAKNVGKGIGDDFETLVSGKGRDEFGYAVALDGLFGLVGARYDDYEGIADAGSVYVYDTQEDLRIGLSVEPLSIRATTTLGQIKRSALLQNFPNPFNPETWMPYQLATDADVQVRIYDISGTLVRQLGMGHQRVGYYVDRERAAYWNGRDENGEQVSSGLYFYQLRAGDYSAVKRMVILK